MWSLSQRSNAHGAGSVNRDGQCVRIELAPSGAIVSQETLPDTQWTVANQIRVSRSGRWTHKGLRAPGT